SEGFMVDGVMSGQIALPAGTIAEPFIDIDDIAEVAAACLLNPELEGQVIEVTGPELLTFEDCTRILSAEIGRPIHFQAITVEQFTGALKSIGLDADYLWLMHELFAVVMDGRNSWVSDGVEKILGRPATSFAEYVAKTAALGVWDLPSQRAAV
ncbi:MAG: NmrA family transcriptional regulator, partial [Pseudomonadota bacterium]